MVRPNATHAGIITTHAYCQRLHDIASASSDPHAANLLIDLAATLPNIRGALPRADQLLADQLDANEQAVHAAHAAALAAVCAAAAFLNNSLNAALLTNAAALGECATQLNALAQTSGELALRIHARTVLLKLEA